MSKYKSRQTQKEAAHGLQNPPHVVRHIGRFFNWLDGDSLGALIITACLSFLLLWLLIGLFICL